VAAILAGARVGERIGPRVSQAHRVIQLAIRQQPGIGGDRRAAKLQHHATVEIEPQRTPVCFTVGSAMIALLGPPQDAEF
jgi:hypothetical protein